MAEREKVRKKLIKFEREGEGLRINGREKNKSNRERE